MNLSDEIARANLTKAGLLSRVDLRVAYLKGRVPENATFSLSLRV